MLIALFFPHDLQIRLDLLRVLLPLIFFGPHRFQITGFLRLLLPVLSVLIGRRAGRCLLRLFLRLLIVFHALPEAVVVYRKLPSEGLLHAVIAVPREEPRVDLFRRQDLELSLQLFIPALPKRRVGPCDHIIGHGIHHGFRRYITAQVPKLRVLPVPG